MRILKASPNGIGGTLTDKQISPADQKRMILSAIQKSTPMPAEKIVIYAPEGWGKTTWASKAERPIFISSEDGLKGVSVDCFPEPRSWQDLFDAVEELRTRDHNFKTLVIDTLDWTQHICENYLLAKTGSASIETIGGGFGKGFNICSEEWRRLLMPIDRLRHEKLMHVAFLSHCEVKTFNNPSGDNYDRYQLKTDKRISSIIREWADAVLFGNYDVAVDVEKGQKKGKGYGSDRVIYTTHSAAWDGKNRYSLSDQISSDPKEFWSAVDVFYQNKNGGVQ